MNAPPLEDRFTEPDGWRWHHFTRKSKTGDRTLRFGSVFPKDSVPDAVVVCLPGLSEFGEKYFEVARTCLGLNLAFWVIDWMGQGASARYLKNPQKRHSRDFEEDVEDLHFLYTEYIKHSSVHPDVGRIPVAMLSHSMGGNIGLQYLHRHPDVFECAGFSAPMFGIQTLSALPQWFSNGLSATLKNMAGGCFVFGGGPWNDNMRAFDGKDALSRDPERVKLHSWWFAEKPDLQVGSPTFGWIYHALQACERVCDADFSSQVSTPCYIGLAEDDRLIENDAARLVAGHLPQCSVQDFPQARHEILMETNTVRDAFFKSFYALIEETIIQKPETLKPF